MKKHMTLYTGPHCHLCEQAKAVLYPLLTEKALQLIEVNIEDDPRLQDSYASRIPVLVLPDGGEKGWPFTAAQILRMLG